jgi:hypothetical protein
MSYSTAELNMLIQQGKCHIPYVSENMDTSLSCIGEIVSLLKQFFEGETYIVENFWKRFNQIQHFI